MKNSLIIYCTIKNKDVYLQSRTIIIVLIIEKTKDMKANFTEEEKALLSEFIVIEEVNSDYPSKFILSRDSFDRMNVCDTYDENGFNVSHTDAGDYCNENSYYEDEDIAAEDEVYTSCIAYNFHDGHNWQTIIIEHDSDEITHKELSSEKQLEILKAYESVEFEESNGLIQEAKTDNFTFYKSREQGCFYTVKVD